MPVVAHDSSARPLTVKFGTHKSCQTADGLSCVAAQEMQDLDQQIHATRLALQKLETRRDSVRYAINRSHDPISRRMPPEIASAIFQFYAGSSYDPRSVPIEDQPNALVLGSVCRAWRDIAWSTPRIWSTLFLYFEFPRSNVSYPKVRILAELAQEWLDRSGQLPLTITFVTHSDLQDETPSKYTVLYPMIELIKQYHTRWECFYISVSPFLLPLFFRRLENLTMLKALDVASASEETYTGSLSMEDPALAPCSLRIDCIKLHCIAMSWDNLSSVEASHLSMNECLELLRRAPILENFLVDSIYQPGDRFLMPSTPIVHRHLQVLSLTPFNDDRPSHLLDLFFANSTLPSLKSLICRLKSNKHTISPAAIQSFLLRSSCRLSELYLRANPKKINFISILQKSPYLRSLKMMTHNQQPAPLNDLLQLLAETSESAVNKNLEREAFLPLLECLGLCIWTTDITKFKWHLVAPIFGPLSKVGSSEQRPLKRLKVTLVRPADQRRQPVKLVETAVSSKLRKLKDAGISLTVVGESGEEAI